MGPNGSAARIGIKAHHDPALGEDMANVALDLDATDWHTYGASWTAQRTEFFVDDKVVRTVDQGLGYQLQLMIGLFEFPVGDRRDPSDVAAVRGYRPAPRRV